MDVPRKGYSESGTLGSRDNFKYRGYVKEGQSMHKITETTEITIKVNKDNIKTVQTALQTLLRPLYDTKNDSIYNKCIRIDQNMDILTPQEKKIIKIVLTGRTYVEIAEILDISINTLKTHMKNIFNKYNVTSKVELTNKFQIHIH